MKIIQVVHFSKESAEDVAIEASNFIEDHAYDVTSVDIKQDRCSPFKWHSFISYYDAD